MGPTRQSRSSGRLLYPWLAVPLIIVCAAVFGLGADGAAGSYFFSALLLAGLALASARGTVRLGPAVLAGLAAYGGLLVLALARGWLSSGGPEYATLAAGGAVLLLGRAAARRSERFDLLWTATLALGGALALAAFMDFVLSPGQIFGHPKPFHDGRLSAPFLSANTAGTVYGVFAILAVAGIVRAVRAARAGARHSEATDRLRRLTLPVAVALLTSTCLLLSASRAALILTAIAILVYLAWEAATWRQSSPRGAPVILLTGVSLLAALGAFLFLLSGDMVGGRLDRLQDGAGDRTALIIAYAEAVRYAPVSGQGLGGFGYASDLVATADNATLLVEQRAAHNLVLQWLLQTGLTGSLAVAALLTGVVLRLFRGCRQRRRGRSRLRAAIIVLGLVLAHGQVDYAMEIPAAMFLVMWLTGLALGRADGRSQGVPARPAAEYALAALAATATILCSIAFLGQARAEAWLHEAPPRIEAWLAAGAPESGPRRRAEIFADLALAAGPAHADAATAALERVVRLEPRDGRAWARLSYARQRRGDTAEAVLGALSQSYLRLPYGEPDFARWRLAYAEALWPILPVELKSAATREVRLQPTEFREAWLARTAG